MNKYLNQDDPLVSIVIPVYNGSNYIKEAINSSLNQTYSNIEIIVVNDGSNDDGLTRNIVLQYEDKIKYIEKSNGGVATALNKGIEIMNGDFFSWLSHDDLYYPNKISDQVKFYKNLSQKKSIIFSSEYIIDSDGKIIGDSLGNTLRDKNIVYNMLTKRFIGGCSLLIPRFAFTDCGMFDTNLITVQDYELWFRFIYSGFNFIYLPIHSGMSRIHGDQVSIKKKKILHKEKDFLFSRIVDDNRIISLIEGDRKSTYTKMAIEFYSQRLQKTGDACMTVAKRSKFFVFFYKIFSLVSFLKMAIHYKLKYYYQILLESSKS